MYVDSAPAVNSILCVTINNSPLVGTFLADAGTVTATRLDAAGVARAYTYIPPTTRVPYWNPTTSAEKLGKYEANSRVQASVVESGVMRPVSGGWWAVPYPDASGSCSVAPGYYVKFREGLSPRQCTRAPAILSAATCEAWGSDRLLSYLKIATSPGKVPSPSSIPTFASGADWVSITTNTIYVGNVNSGALGGNGTEYHLNSGAAYASDTCTCRGVLTNIAYTVFYNGATQVISSVAADVVVAELTGCTAVLAPPITVSMVWQDTAPTGTVLPKLDRSGAPGYAWGAPLLGGAMITQSGVPYTAVTSSDKLAVSRGPPYASRTAFHGATVIAGQGGDAGAALSIRGPNWGGACNASSPSLLSIPGADQAQPVPLSFGEDLAVSCTVALSEPELAAACAAATGTQPPYMGLWPVYLPPGYSTSYAPPTHVGTLGASNPWQSWQWTPISTPTSYPPSTVSYDASNAVCTNMPATLSIELLYSFVGEAANPQGKVLAVRYRYMPDTWSMRREDVRVATPQGKQTFTFNTVVTWTQDPTTLRASTLYAAAPQIVPSLPSDLWYPFT